MKFTSLIMNLRRSKTLSPYDLWEGQESKKLAGQKQTKDKKTHHPSLRRTRGTAIPHPGQSYNPDPEEHDRLLKKVAKKEINEQKKAKAINKAMKVKVDKHELQEHEQAQLVAGIDHLIAKEKISKEDNEASSTDTAYSDYDEKDFESILKDKSVQEKRKTHQQRLRQLKDRLIRKAAKLRKLKNIRLSKFDAIKKMIKELEKEEKLREDKLGKKKKNRKIKNERLAQRFEAPDPIYCVKSELPKSLKDVKCPMDAIVREQLDSFKAKLMVEPTTYQTKKPKYKKPVFERKTASERD